MKNNLEGILEGQVKRYNPKTKFLYYLKSCLRNSIIAGTTFLASINSAYSQDSKLIEPSYSAVVYRSIINNSFDEYARIETDNPPVGFVDGNPKQINRAFLYFDIPEEINIQDINSALLFFKLDESYSWNGNIDSIRIYHKRLPKEQFKTSKPELSLWNLSEINYVGSTVNDSMLEAVVQIPDFSNIADYLIGNNLSSVGFGLRAEPESPEGNNFTFIKDPRLYLQTLDPNQNTIDCLVDCVNDYLDLDKEEVPCLTVKLASIIGACGSLPPSCPLFISGASLLCNAKKVISLGEATSCMSTCINDNSCQSDNSCFDGNDCVANQCEEYYIIPQCVNKTLEDGSSCNNSYGTCYSGICFENNTSTPIEQTQTPTFTLEPEISTSTPTKTPTYSPTNTRTNTITSTPTKTPFIINEPTPTINSEGSRIVIGSAQGYPGDIVSFDIGIEFGQNYFGEGAYAISTYFYNDFQNRRFGPFDEEETYRDEGYDITNCYFTSQLNNWVSLGSLNPLHHDYFVDQNREDIFIYEEGIHVGIRAKRDIDYLRNSQNLFECFVRIPERTDPRSYRTTCINWFVRDGIGSKIYLSSPLGTKISKDCSPGEIRVLGQGIPTLKPTFTITPTFTSTITQNPTFTITQTPISSFTLTRTPIKTPTFTNTITPTRTTILTSTITQTKTPTAINTQSNTFTQTPVNTPTIAKKIIPGDCNKNGVVSIDELVTGVSIALKKINISVCPEIDINNDGNVSIDELIQGVNSALGKNNFA